MCRHWALSSVVVAKHPLATCGQALSAVQLAAPLWQEQLPMAAGLGDVVPICVYERSFPGILQRPELWAPFSICLAACQVLGDP